MSPPRKYPVPDQYINRLITKQDPSLPPIKEIYTPEFKTLFNDARDQNSTEDDRNDSADNSHSEK